MGDRQAQRVAGFGPSIFAEMSMLAFQQQAINLGQGFPDFAASDLIKQAAAEAIAADLNQYAPPFGVARLRQALAAQWERDYARAVDWQREVTITSGATEGLYGLIQALINPGEQVVVIEPAYDAYHADISMAGGVALPVRLIPPATNAERWSLDLVALAAACAQRPKLLLLNTPHNPTGMVLSRTELEQIAELCQHYDILVLSDEVYDRMVYAPAEHVPIATLPGMWERTITLGSTGKTFGVTGWKVGWAIGSAALNQALRNAHQWITFATPTPLQEATAVAIEHAATSGYYAELQAAYRERHAILAEHLRQAGLAPLPVEGAYFVSIDLRHLGHLGATSDQRFCRWLITEIGVAAIPTSPFYSDPSSAPAIVRFCFAKQHATLAAAGQRLQQIPERLGSLVGL